MRVLYLNLFEFYATKCSMCGLEKISLKATYINGGGQTIYIWFFLRECVNSFVFSSAFLQEVNEIWSDPFSFLFFCTHFPMHVRLINCVDRKPVTLSKCIFLFFFETDISYRSHLYRMFITENLGHSTSL